LKPFIHSTGVHAEDFVKELSSLCGVQHGNKLPTYTGSWDNEDSDENDVRVLSGLTEWQKKEIEAGRSKRLTWEQFSKPDQSHGLAKFVQSLMHYPTKINASGPVRILDLGCGPGTDLLALQAALHVSKKDSLCLDVSESSRPELTNIRLDPSSSSTYHDSLEQALVGNENTVHVAVSMVAFHHIPDPTMRSDALTFVRRVLAPGGIFIMAEWDNSVQPNRWIHYDLVHILPGMLFSLSAPQSKDELKIGTKYLSVDNWIAAGEKAGLHYEKDRTKGRTGGMPQEQAALELHAEHDCIDPALLNVRK